MQRLLVPIRSVRVNYKKLRKLHPKKVARYEYDYERGDDFPPIQVEDCGGFYTIRDGRHRYIAQYNLGYQMIDVVVVRGGDAVFARDVQDVPLSRRSVPLLKNVFLSKANILLPRVNDYHSTACRRCSR